MGKITAKKPGSRQESLKQAHSRIADKAIRRMKFSDLGEVSNLEISAYTCPWPLTAFREEIIPDPFRSAYVLVDLKRPCILGYSCFWILEGELSLLNLTIHPDHRRLGLGTEFLGWILTMGARRGAARALLEVRVSNRDAIRLYEKAGFARHGRRRNYYQSPEEDALILCHRTLDTLTI